LFILVGGLFASINVPLPTAAASLPVVQSISPQSGPIAGGTAIIISGQNFAAPIYVDFDGQHVTPIVNTPSQLTVTSPSHAAGVVHLFVTTSAGTSSPTAADNFTYLKPPAISLVSPNVGPTSGGTAVTITGTNLSGVTEVRFGSTSVAPVLATASSVLTYSPAHSAGTVDVRVRNSGGLSDTSAAARFTYSPSGPVVTAVSPSSGTTAGGTLVSISGANLLGASSVTFGNVVVAPSSVTDSLVQVVAPAHVSGLVHLRVTTPLGTSPSTIGDDFTYTVGIPTVLGISPRAGPVEGGTLITLTGTGFTGTTSVQFGSAFVAPATVSEGQVTVIAPSHAAGVVHLLVTNAFGTSAETSLDDYTYGLGYPTVTSVAPKSGPITGGTFITITGTGLATATAVTFGDQLVTPVSATATSVLVVAPGHAAGTVHLRVVTVIGTSPETSADDYTYAAAPPVVLGISPSTGSVNGGTDVTITGRGFTGAFAVSFGDASAVPTVVSDTTLRVVAPPSAIPGLAHLRVTTPAGPSAETAADNFTYVANPRVTSVSPRTGTVAGGALIVIHGFGFTGTTVVNFGIVHVIPTVVTDTEIQVVAPPHEAGLVHLRITSTGGTSPDSATDDFTYVPAGPELCPLTPLWVNDLAYGSAGGGFYWDPTSGLVWTAQRTWHLFSPQPARTPSPLWVNAVTYGSPGGGFYWDSVSGQVWTAQRGWHPYAPQGCVAR
jgi:hypothetical protein